MSLEIFCKYSTIPRHIGGSSLRTKDEAGHFLESPEFFPAYDTDNRCYEAKSTIAITPTWRALLWPSLIPILIFLNKSLGYPNVF